jgi:chorismate--pyruvate lyase
LLDWLYNPASLTARLKTHCRDFKVEVLFEQPIPASHCAEFDPMFNANFSECRLRQVLLWCDDQPWVFASTVIPEETLQQNSEWLEKLGNKPLGEALFNNPDVTRGPLSVSAFNLHNQLFQQQRNEAVNYRALWGRRSVFNINQAPLAVSEIFLPDSLAYEP